jgi:Zn-dependent peptidase ImmA (M78 family)
MNATIYRAPALLLKELGISEPAEIRIEAIAQYCGATIVYERLEGCSARIIGHGDRAIITVDSESGRPRQRFSAAHELGHWSWDRGKVGFACTERMFDSEWKGLNPEQRANEYAADLLLPEFLFVPRSAGRDVTFTTVEALARDFETSMTAAAIRLVQHGSFPAMVIWSEHSKRKWFIRGPGVPTTVWPKEQPKRDTVASDLFEGKNANTTPLEIYADSWIEHAGLGRSSVVEDSINVGQSQVLTLLWWKDERPLLDLAEGDEAFDES